MKKNIILFIKGIVLGIANIIPGVSGGTLAITLGLYERIIGCVTHFFKNFKNNLKFLIPIGIGILLAIGLLSNVISFALKNYKIETVFCFAGLILGGLPVLLKKINKGNPKTKHILAFLFTFGLIILFTFFKPGDSSVNLDVLNLRQIILLFVVGILAAATMVIPGISGSFVLMLIGYYEPIVNIVKDLTHLNNIWQNILILIPFGIGVVAGIFIIAKLIEYLLKKDEVTTYYGIIGFVISSIVSIVLPLTGWGFRSVTIGLLLAIIGFIASYSLTRSE